MYTKKESDIVFKYKPNWIVEKYPDFKHCKIEGKIVSIDFSYRASEETYKLLKGNGETLFKGIDNIETFINFGYVVVEVKNGKYKSSKNIIVFDENKPISQYKNELLKILTDGCTIVTYNGWRAEFPILLRRFGIDLKKYHLIDTMRIEKQFGNDSLRELLCLDNTYPKIPQKTNKLQLDDLVKFYCDKTMFESEISPGHESIQDALANLDVFFQQFYRYGFTCIEEEEQMSKYIHTMQDEKNYLKYNLINEYKLFTKIDEISYKKDNKFVFKMGEKMKGKTITEISNQTLCYILVKYDIWYKGKPDPFLYEILYVARLEWARRFDNKQLENNY